LTVTCRSAGWGTYLAGDCLSGAQLRCGGVFLCNACLKRSSGIDVCRHATFADTPTASTHHHTDIRKPATTPKCCPIFPSLPCVVSTVI